MTLDNLTQLQKIAIEGEVAGALSTAKHNPEILYRLYVVLQNAPKEMSDYIISIVKDLTDIKEAELNRVILELSSDEFPLWIWINKTVADIKLSLTLASAEGMICEASIDKKLVQKKIVKSAFVCFCRSIALASPKAAISLCKYILDEEPIVLEFLSDTCFSLIAEISELEDKESIPDELLHKAFDIRNMLSYRIETEVIEAFNKRENKATIKTEPVKREKKDTGASEEVKGIKISDVVDQVMTQILNESLSKPKKEEAPKGFAVVKKYEGNNIASVLKTFKTEQEAIEFKNKIQEGYPEIIKNCSLEIKPIN